MRVLLAVFALFLASIGAHAQVYHGNDTGGIIPGRARTRSTPAAIAARLLRGLDKHARITSVHRITATTSPSIACGAARQSLCAAGRAYPSELWL